jgi:hypothetical protein
MHIAALILASLLMMTPAQDSTMKGIQFRDMGHIQYDTEIVSDPKVERLYGVANFLFDFVEARCTPPCLLEPEMFDITIHIVPYAVFEDELLVLLDKDDPELAARIRGEGGLIDGHTQFRGTFPINIYFYDNPPDTLFIHEMLHVLYPYDPEEVIVQRQLYILGSRDYKDWLRNNY